MWPNPPIFEFYLFKKHLNHSITKNKKILWIRNGGHSPKFTQQVSLEYQRWLADGAFYCRLDVCNLCTLLFQTQFLSNYPTIIIFHLYNNTPQVNNKCIISCNHLLTCYAKVITSLRWNKTRTRLQSYLGHGHLLHTCQSYRFMR